MSSGWVRSQSWLMKLRPSSWVWKIWRDEKPKGERIEKRGFKFQFYYIQVEWFYVNNRVDPQLSHLWNGAAKITFSHRFVLWIAHRIMSNPMQTSRACTCHDYFWSHSKVMPRLTYHMCALSCIVPAKSYVADQYWPKWLHILKHCLTPSTQGQETVSIQHQYLGWYN